MKAFLLLFTCLLCMLLWPTTAEAAAVQNIRLAAYQENVVRLVVELDSKIEAKVFPPFQTVTSGR